MPSPVTEEIFSGKSYRLKDIKGNTVELVRIGLDLYEFGEFKLCDELYLPFGKKLYEYFKANSYVIMTDDLDYDRPKIQLLEKNGFVIYYTKMIYNKNLDEHEFKFNDIFEYRSLEQSGIDEFLETYKLVQSDDPEGEIDPRTDVNELVEYAGKEYHPRNWFIVMLNEKPIGIIMPQKFAAEKSLAGLMHIGLIPQERNKGYGKILFSKSLQILKEIGIEKYMGSTNINNIPMRKVFESSGCKEWFKRFFYRAS
jgi:GNAT superfamily N-acetyltransferase